MKLNLTAFIYEDHLTPKGLLPREEKVHASAMWHFCKLATQVLANIPDQVTYEGQKDKTVTLRALAESVKKMYAIKDMNRMMAFGDFVKAEAKANKLPWDHRLEAFIASGGTSFNVVTRDPDVLNQS